VSAEGNRPPERAAFSAPEAPTFRCPSCGGPAAKDARACVHCGGLLATNRCISCFALSPREAERCLKCGALLPAPALVAEGAGSCPDCRLELVAHAFGAVGYSECPRCSGLFLKKESFEAVTKDADTRAKVRLAEPVTTPAASPGGPAKTASGTLPPVRYRPCPGCGKLMNRTNYGGGSGIVLDACRDHGLWFDRGELASIVDFLEKGGWDRVRARERERLSEEVRALESRRALSRATGMPTSDWHRQQQGLDALGGMVGLLSALAGWFLRR
jgi:Zn-finger nucleic acid-binding protein